MIKIVIIEDERNSQQILSNLIEVQFPEIKIIGIYGTVKEGVQAINSKRPDIVFLDVELEDGSGFDVLIGTQGIEYSVIFTTAYNSYAIQAFKASASGYILKPVDQNELYSVTRKTIDNLKNVNAKELLSELISINLANKDLKVCLPIKDGVEWIFQNSIITLEGQGNYTKIYTNKETKLVTRQIGKIIENLSKRHFFRVHESYAINKDHILQYHRTDGGFLIMSNNDRVPVSRLRKAAFVEWMGNEV